MMAQIARRPSISMEPYPMSLAFFSLSSCLELVPELTKEWKPEMAPQATVTNRTGKSHWPPPRSKPTNGEISMVG